MRIQVHFSIVSFILYFITLVGYGQSAQLPLDFESLSETHPSVLLEVRYATSDNFIGSPVNGYLQPKIYLSKAALKALGNVQDDLGKKGLGLKVFDGYRPQRAVNHFLKWSQSLADTLMKATYYPTISKNKLFALGYIAARSGHSRGSTVDVTIVTLATGKELDMGSPYDFFGPISGVYSNEITSKQQQHRLLLRKAMLRHGFKPLKEEWWHFTLTKEPYPTTYFDVVIE
jgi:zinc D-Ala-D-Ala dipeptidase